MGLHSGAANFFNVSFSVRMLNRKRSIKFLTVCSKFSQGNFVPNAAVYSVRAVVNSGCRYDDVNFAVGGEDWDFWMCLAEVSFRSKLFLSWKLISFVLLNSMVIGGEQYRNHSTGTEETLLLSELLVGETCLSMDSQLSRLEFTRNTLLSSKLANSPTSQLALRNNSNVSTGLLPSKLTSLASRRVSCLSFPGFTLEELTSVCLLSLALSYLPLCVLTVLAYPGALHMIQLFAERGYRVTVVCTLYRNPAGIELRPQVLQYTHDVHILPSFLRAPDIPRYLKYLVETRGIEEVVFSNSQLIYEMLPALTEQMPHVKFIDVSSSSLISTLENLS